MSKHHFFFYYSEIFLITNKKKASVVSCIHRLEYLFTAKKFLDGFSLLFNVNNHKVIQKMQNWRFLNIRRNCVWYTEKVEVFLFSSFGLLFYCLFTTTCRQMTFSTSTITNKCKFRVFLKYSMLWYNMKFNKQVDYNCNKTHIRFGFHLAFQGRIRWLSTVCVGTIRKLISAFSINRAE